MHDENTPSEGEFCFELERGLAAFYCLRRKEYVECFRGGVV